MKLTIEPTNTLEILWSGTQARLWTGKTEDGTPVNLWISAIAAQDGARLPDAFLDAFPPSRRSREPVVFTSKLVL